jgi:hypothetical protein
MVMNNREYRGYLYVNEQGAKSNKDFEYWVNLCLDFNRRAKASPKQKKWFSTSGQDKAVVVARDPKQVMQELARRNLIRPDTTQEQIGRCIGRPDSLQRPDHFRRFWRSFFDTSSSAFHRQACPTSAFG